MSVEFNDSRCPLCGHKMIFHDGVECTVCESKCYERWAKLVKKVTADKLKIQMAEILGKLKAIGEDVQITMPIQEQDLSLGQKPKFRLMED